MSDESSSILIVDDEEMNREGLARRLQRYGYTVTLANSGREALELLGQSRFDLVLLDIMMPGMNGLDVLKFLRRVDSLIDLPIVMVTARSESEDVIEALELGANDYVTKPLDFPVVLARIRLQLALKQALAQSTKLEQKLDSRNKELEATAAELAAANERMRRDLEAAARIQQALLPTLPPEAPGARFAWAFRPCSQLAGDYLNVFRLDDRHMGLCVFDVSGHGVATALLSITASHLLAQIAGGAGEGIVPVTEVAARLGEQFASGSTVGHTLTLIYGILNLDIGEFRFVSAGNPGPIHMPMPPAPPVRLEVSGLPVGIAGRNLCEHKVALQPGDRLFLYSDGVTAARNADGEHFGIHRLLSVLEQTRHLPLAESTGGLVRRLGEWSGKTAGHDDISVLGVERTNLDCVGREVHREVI